MPEMNFSPYVQKGLPGVKLSPKINADNYDCLWDAGSGTAKGFNASLEYCKAHDHCWHLGCILPKLPAMSVRTGGGWFGPCCIPKGSEPPRNAPGPPTRMELDVPERRTGAPQEPEHFAGLGRHHLEQVASAHVRGVAGRYGSLRYIVSTRGNRHSATPKKSRAEGGFRSFQAVSTTWSAAGAQRTR